METLVMPVSPELQTLIETRLDLVDRVLLEARLSRAERTGILQELEGQILEQLERRTNQPTRDDVLAVFAELDPPEAFLPDGDERAPATVRTRRPAGPPETARPQNVASPSGLTLWAGWLVAGTSLMTGLLMSAGVWFAPEAVIAIVAAIQVAALTGAAIGCAALLRTGASTATGLERLVAGAAAATGALTLTFLLVLASVFTDSELAVFVLSGFVGGAWMHGAWLAAATGALWMRRAR